MEKLYSRTGRPLRSIWSLRAVMPTRELVRAQNEEERKLFGRFGINYDDYRVYVRSAEGERDYPNMQLQLNINRGAIDALKWAMENAVTRGLTTTEYLRFFLEARSLVEANIENQAKST